MIEDDGELKKLVMLTVVSLITWVIICQNKELLDIFSLHNFDVFNVSEFDLGCTKLLEYSFELNSNPVRQALRRHPVAYLLLIDDRVDQMLQTYITQPMPGSEWMANIFLFGRKTEI